MESYKFKHGDIIYCDASFLVRFLYKDYCSGVYEAEAAKLFALILVSNSRLCVSTLAVDELMPAIKKGSANEKFLPNWKLNVNKVLDKWKLFPNKRYYSKIGLSYKAVLHDIRLSVSLLLSSSPEFLEFLDYPKGVSLAIDYLENGYAEKPRDAFHLAIAIQNGAKYLITADEDLWKRSKSLPIKRILLSSK